MDVANLPQPNENYEDWRERLNTELVALDASIPSVPVDSVFGRTGAVVGADSDYDTDNIDNASGVAGANVSAALDQLDGDVSTNASGVAALAPEVNSKAYADSPYTLPTARINMIQGNSNGGTTLFYTPASPTAGDLIFIIKSDSSSDQLRLLGTSGAKINNAAGVIYATQKEGGHYWCDGTDWWGVTF